MSTVKVNTLTTVDGTHSVNVANLAEGDTTPAGTIINYGGIAAPEGYLACDGAEVDQLTYPALYAAIGDAWALTGGALAPAAGNFRLPPSAIGGLGLYMRGVGGAVVGEFQGDVLKEHDHAITVYNNAQGICTEHTGAACTDHPSTVRQTTMSGDPTETRPASITTSLFIKAFNGAINEENISITALANELNALANELNALKAAIPNPKSEITAWVSFNGADGSILDGLGISVTRTELGKYSVLFEPPMDNTNYAILMDGRRLSTAASSKIELKASYGTDNSITGFDVTSFNEAGVPFDAFIGYITIIGGKN